MDILIAGSRFANGVAGMMEDGLIRRGHHVAFTELGAQPVTSLLGRAIARGKRLGRRLAPNSYRLLSDIERIRPKYVVVADGKALCPEEIALCRAAVHATGGRIATYLCDDPFAPAFLSSPWQQSLRHYDIVFSTKRNIMDDVRCAGAADVRFIWFAFDPLLHRQREDIAVSATRWRCDIAFAGASDSDRLPIFETLQQAIPTADIRLYSGRWGKSRVLRACAQPPVYGLDYCHAMLGAQICPCLVRRTNRDGHVMRTFELLAMGCFMLAERTEEHLELLEEDKHCVMWGSTEELVDKCRWYLARESQGRRLATAGCQLVRTGQHTYADRVLRMLAALRDC